MGFSISATDANIESTSILAIAGDTSSSLSYTWAYKVDGQKNYTIIATKQRSKSYSWKVPKRIYELIPDAQAAYISIRCQVYASGLNLKATVYCDMVALVPPSKNKPSLTIDAYDINPLTTELTGNKNVIIPGYSKVQVDIKPTLKNYATLSNAEVALDNSVVDVKKTLSAIYEKAKGTFASASIIDSRGFYAYAEEALQKVDYFIPTVKISYSRASSTSNSVTVKISGKWFNQSFGAVKNTLQVRIHYAEQEGSYNAFAELTPTINGNGYSASVTYDDMDYEKVYKVQVEVTDRIRCNPYDGEWPTRIYASSLIKRGIPVFDWGKDDFRVNKVLRVVGGIQSEQTITTNPSGADRVWALHHYRGSTYNGVESVEQFFLGLSKSHDRGYACITLALGDGGSESAKTRLDIYKPEGDDNTDVYAAIRACSVGQHSGILRLGKKLQWSGAIYASGDVSGATITNRSDRKIKKNIRKNEKTDALDAVNALRIYDYQLIDDDSTVKMGLMADEAPTDILSEDGTGINLYSYCGLLAKAIQELSKNLKRKAE